VDEYDMSSSDGNRVEEDFRRTGADPEPVEDPYQFGSLGRALWRERSLERMLRIKLALGVEDARKIVADLLSASRPTCL